MSWIVLVRWLHILTAAAWLGQVVVLNFVLVPAVVKEERAEARLDLLQKLFPPIFRLASILSGLSVVAGGFLLWGRHHEDWSTLFASWHGHALVTGATLAVLLMAFHHALEPKLGRMIRKAHEAKDAAASDAIVRKLKIAPRIGLGVLTLVMVLMMIGVRGV
jgi:uncharacterized membrane protein